MERASQGRRVPVPALLAILATSLVGVVDECIQKFLPSRVFDLVDILFNVVAGVMAVAASVAIVPGIVTPVDHGSSVGRQRVESLSAPR